MKYRSEEDILHLSTGRKSRESVPIGGLVVDLDNEQNPVAIEILNASNVIGEMYDGDIRKLLNSISDTERSSRGRHTS